MIAYRKNVSVCMCASFLLFFRVRWAIWLHSFLIIAQLFTLNMSCRAAQIILKDGLIYITAVLEQRKMLLGKAMAQYWSDVLNVNNVFAVQQMPLPYLLRSIATSGKSELYFMTLSDHNANRLRYVYTLLLCFYSTSFYSCSDLSSGSTLIYSVASMLTINYYAD